MLTKRLAIYLSLRISEVYIRAGENAPTGRCSSAAHRAAPATRRCLRDAAKGAAFETPLNPLGDLPAPVFYGSPNIESDLFGTGFSEEILGAQEGRVYSMQSWDDPIEIAAN